MIGWRAARTDTSDHDNFIELATREGVPEDHGELGTSIGNMRCVIFRRIEGADTLFESQERLVYFSTFLESIIVISLAVLRSFWTSQVHQQKPSTVLLAFLCNFNLSDSVGPRRSIIRFSRCCSPDSIPKLDQLLEFLFTWDKLLLETLDLYFILFIL